MFRFKVVATLFLVFAAAGGVVYYHQDEAISEGVQQKIKDRVEAARHSLTRSRSLSDFALMAKTAEVANGAQIAQILARTPESFADPEGNPLGEDDFHYEVHKLMNKELDLWKEKFKALAEHKGKPSHELADLLTSPPDWFVVLDAKGIGVANAADLAWFGEAEANVLEERPALKRTLEGGERLRDIWIIKGSPMTVSAAPVRQGQKILGAVVLGYRLTDAEANRDKARVSTEVAYFVRDRLNQSSSLSSADEPELQKHLADKQLYKGERALLELDLRGVNYIAAVGTLEGYASAKDVGFIVLVDQTHTLKADKEVLIWIPASFIVAFFLALGVILGFFQQFLAPFEGIDQGVMEIINGNLDYWFEASGRELPSTMSQNLNIMVCLLSGRPLPEDDEATEGEHWAEDRLFIDELNASEFHQKPVSAAAVIAGEEHGLDPRIISLVKEDEETYKRRLFKEYTAALRETDQPIQGITFEKFTRNVDNNASALKEKYSCAQVRFIILIQEGKVTLTPIPIL
ncbi:hypothetical protein KKF91_13135 [Myxococcota bacterium]|nr:hypothetical protein [Myxococcota bacterium]MBU1431480.1 hypothetical protein [Myxococcota bacterium]MBU1897629.1 hypothetical protein [Myxococcota bacterium]